MSETGDAILVFLRYPEAGKVKTRLAAEIGAARAARIYARLASEVLGQVAAVPDVSRYAYFDPPEMEDGVEVWLRQWPGAFALAAQSDGCLGDRMEAALRRTFVRNRNRRVLIVGTDCPSVTSGLLLQAFEALASSQVVLGPATDGGYYLLGTQEHYPWLLEGIPWSTSGVLDATVKACRREGVSVVQLEMKRDIDTLADLRDTMPDWQDLPGVPGFLTGS